MNEAGVDISDQNSELINMDIPNNATLAVTLCGDAADKCPGNSTPCKAGSLGGVMILRKHRGQKKKGEKYSSEFAMKLKSG